MNKDNTRTTALEQIRHLAGDLKRASNPREELAISERMKEVAETLQTSKVGGPPKSAYKG